MAIIRILQVIGSLNNGGSQAMIMNIYRNIDRTKIQFDFIIDRPEELFFAEEIKKMGGKIFLLKSINYCNTFEYTKQWNLFLNEHLEYKIIHGHVRSTAAIYLKIAQKHGLLTIAHSHSTSSGKGITGIIKNVLQYPIRYIADYLFACSSSAGEWLYGKNVLQKQNFIILNNGIDIERFLPNLEDRNNKRAELGLEGKFIVGNVGRFDYPKNHMFLIEIFKVVHDRNKDAVLVLVGDGELRTQIEKKIIDMDLQENVIITGVRIDIPQLLQAMDVFLFPSLFEGLGIVTIEAQAAGLQCIVADTIPQEVFITDLIQAVSLKASPQEWANIILSSTLKSNRRDTYEEIKRAGYDIKRTAKRQEEFYLSK